ncbi:MAG: type II secretion system protein GspM [Hylemonella sp.]|uniref:type II secretion system protein GspM n=1 Tax=Hylemonella sp. TaxID=2066020 RepID=UPI0022BF09A4|nr:type II secretion system protein GspM [Hylemonella sp.]MCZ8252322.1 type II secretion system protein GspM [Hylemonella sp.]
MTGLHALWPDRWHALPARDQRRWRILALGAGALLLWLVLLAPAWRTVQGASQRHALLDRQLETMQRLQRSLEQLRDQPRASPTARVQALEATLARLGSGVQLRVAQGQLTLTLRQVPAGVLADWLLESRAQTGMEAVEARLTRQGQGTAAVWDGVLIYRLPQPEPDAG